MSGIPKYCNAELRHKDMPYPRTCAQCGLGPCPYGVPSPVDTEAKANEIPNGPDFPVSTIDGFTEHGMTLRDYFAAQAMRIVPAQNATNMRPNEPGSDYIARRSYEYADAMLKRRPA